MLSKKDIFSDVEKESAIENIQLRERNDFTMSLDQSQRRLDSFAKLLSLNSECVAVTVINGEVWIAANDLHKGSKPTNTTITFINQVCDYFGKIANENKVGTNEEREKLFKAICSKLRIQKKLKKQFNVLNLTDMEIANVARSVFESRGQYTTRDILKKVKDVGDPFQRHSSGKASEFAYVYTEFAKLYIKLVKLEEALVGNLVFTEEQRFAFKNKAFKILKNEPNKKNGVHAEVQIVANVVALLSKSKVVKTEKIYIGVSKLCCLNCRCMIEESNSIFRERNINIQFSIRGKHDIDFDWNVPEIFETGYKMVAITDISNVSDLGILIGHASSLVIVELLKKPEPEYISMEQSESQSDTEEEWKSRIEAEKKKLEEVYLFIKSQHSSSELIAKKILITLEIYSDLTNVLLLIRKSIFNKTKEEWNVTEDFHLVLDGLNEKKEKSTEISETELIEVLRTPFLVGTDLSGYFANLNLESKKDVKEVITIAEEKRKVDAISTNPTAGIIAETELNPSKKLKVEVQETQTFDLGDKTIVPSAQEGAPMLSQQKLYKKGLEEKKEKGHDFDHDKESKGKKETLLNN